MKVEKNYNKMKKRFKKLKVEKKLKNMEKIWKKTSKKLKTAKPIGKCKNNPSFYLYKLYSIALYSITFCENVKKKEIVVYFQTRISPYYPFNFFSCFLKNNFYVFQKITRRSVVFSAYLRQSVFPGEQ